MLKEVRPLIFSGLSSSSGGIVAKWVPNLCLKAPIHGITLCAFLCIVCSFGLFPRSVSSCPCSTPNRQLDMHFTRSVSHDLFCVVVPPACDPRSSQQIRRGWPVVVFPDLMQWDHHISIYTHQPTCVVVNPSGGTLNPIHSMLNVIRRMDGILPHASGAHHLPRRKGGASLLHRSDITS